MNCPLCGKKGDKALYMGFPARLCRDERCAGIWGIGAYVFQLFPVSDGAFFSFIFYTGSYWSALWSWLRGDFADDDF